MPPAVFCAINTMFHVLLHGGSLSRRWFLVLSVMAWGELTAPSMAQLGPLPWRVNCGDGNGPVPGESGWMLLSEAVAPAGISLDPAPLDTVHVAQTSPTGGVLFPSDVTTVDPDELPQLHRLTSLQLADATVLTLGGLAANQPHRVRLELGALSPWIDVDTSGVHMMGPTASRGVRVEEQTPGTSTWRTLASGVRCATGLNTGTLATTFGGIVPVWCLVHADAAGSVRLRFSTDGDDPLFLAGFEVHEWQNLPLKYKHGAGGVLQASHPALAGFAAAFNAHDFAGAQQVALALADPWRRGVALLHLAGWLDGSRDGLVHLLDDARAALVAAQPFHPGAAWLVSQADQLQRALDHLAARGYATLAACPGEGGFGFLNPDCAGQAKASWGATSVNLNAHIALRLLQGLCAAAVGPTVLADIQAWNAGPGGSGGWEPSPLVFVALKLYGTTLAGINPQLSFKDDDPDAQAMEQAFQDIFRDGFLDPQWGVQDDFPADIELHLYRRYAELGSHPQDWSAADLDSALTAEQVAASWWGALVQDLPDVFGAPPWANRQRETLVALRNASDWWLGERLLDGELGGGLGDDVELLPQLAALEAGQQDQSSRRRLDALDGIARHVLEDSGVVLDGYYAGPIADSEHSAEPTAGMAQMLRWAFGPVRRGLQVGLDAARHLRSADDPAKAWAGLTTLGRLHLRSSWFTTDGPDDDPDHAWDISMNGRALLPAVITGFLAPLGGSHPLAADLRDWAAAWRDDALSPSPGKPTGFLAPAQWPSNALGSAGMWWTATGKPDLDDGLDKTFVLYQLELLRLAYHTSDAADRWRFLLPAVHMLRAAQQWEDAGKPVGAPGSGDWAAQLFHDGPRFHAVVLANLHDLETDPQLTVLDDPTLPGTSPYVDAALVERLHAWGEGTLGLQGANFALAYALAPVAECGAGYTAKPTGYAQNAWDAAFPFLRVAWPLLTTHVLHTDRVFLNRNGVLGALVGGHAGGHHSEGLASRPALRWVGRFGAPLDLAVQVNGYAWDGSWISAYVFNFAAAPTALDLWLDEALPPGAWRIDVGPASTKCDTFAAGTSLVSTLAEKRGAGAKVPLLLPPGLSLVRAVREGPAPEARPFDLALDPPELEVVKQGPAYLLVLRARVANVGSEASPPGTLEFRAALLLPDGTPLGAPPLELSVGSLPVPSLAACSGWYPDEAVLELPIPIDAQVAAVLLSGLAIQLRAVATSAPDEWNLLNNDLARSFLLQEIPLPGAP